VGVYRHEALVIINHLIGSLLLQVHHQSLVVFLRNLVLHLLLEYMFVVLVYASTTLFAHLLFSFCFHFLHVLLLFEVGNFSFDQLLVILVDLVELNGSAFVRDLKGHVVVEVDSPGASFL
jgi:hypothetical protein